MSHQFVKAFEVKLIVHISCIFLFKLFLMINDIYTCETRVFKIVLFLVLLNYWRLLKSTKKKKIYISKNVFFQKNILIFTTKFGRLSLIGALGNGLSGLGLRLALGTVFKFSLILYLPYANK